MEFVDRLLTCTDCGGEFIFTAGEQLFFFDKQFKNDPKRCKPCKSKRSAVALRPGSGPLPLVYRAQKPAPNAPSAASRPLSRSSPLRDVQCSAASASRPSNGPRHQPQPQRRQQNWWPQQPARILAQ